MKKKILGIIVLIALMASAFATTVFATPTPAPAEHTEPLRYGKTTLSGNALYVYEMLEEGVNCENPAQTIEFDGDKTISEQETKLGMLVFISDYPECFWVENDYTFSENGSRVMSISPTYSFTGDALAIARNELEAKVSSILARMPSETNFEKALYLHDKLAELVTYEAVGEHQTAYGALVSGKAVCAGYAAAYQLLLQRAGIQAWTVTGMSTPPNPSSSEPIPHAWNVVWLDDDTCVYTDITWDDQSTTATYHYYFAMSKDEILSTGHVVDDSIFTLPECNHTNESYFDKYNCTVTDTMTVNDVLHLFDMSIQGERCAILYYDGESSLEAWLDTEDPSTGITLITNLCYSLGLDGSSSAECFMHSLGKEYHVTFAGVFAATHHKVTVVPAYGMKITGSAKQSKPIGEAMETVTYTAIDGYYFPEDYPVFTQDGITVARIDGSKITVSGTPTQNTSIVIPLPTEAAKLATPTASFNATGESSGILSGLSTDWKYSIDGGAHWNSIADETVTVESGLTVEKGILLYHPGDGETTSDSDTQIITLTVNEEGLIPISHACTTAENNDGKITGVNDKMEYMPEDAGSGSWIRCTSNEIAGLASGIYYVRTVAEGTSLASRPVYVYVPSVEDVTVTSIEVGNSQITLDVDDSAYITCSVSPSGASTLIYFTSSNPEIVSVDKFTGELTALHQGTATVTIVAQNGGYSTQVSVTVNCTHTHLEPRNATLPPCHGGEHYDYYFCLGCEKMFAPDGTQLSVAPENNHAYMPNFNYDSTSHWHECVCGCKTATEAHSFSEWNEVSPTKRQRVCSVCYYVETEGESRSGGGFSFLFGNKTLILVVVAAILLLFEPVFTLVGMIFTPIDNKKRKKKKDKK
jgi:hypothetical protein